jgi:lipopolysaccharide/colanic/teichoic acid biosynthesis glycosyltransferase
VRPGITGWAQVNGRNLITWEEKFELDIYYVDNISFDLDAKIFLKTFLILITREGINSNKQTTMNPFNGNN